MDSPSSAPAQQQQQQQILPAEAAFSIMFVSVGMSCFIWQTCRAGWMFYKVQKPIHGVVFAQALLGAILTFVTLLASLVPVDCTFLLIFSVVAVNTGDIALQSVLLWKAYLGNNRSKVVLVVGCMPLIGIAVFIFINITIGRSDSNFGQGVCSVEYPMYIVIVKAALDFSSNTFLSWCFILVIYRHYKVLDSSVQKTLLKEGLLYCFGVCLSNILTGILLTLRVLGGSSPILYTIDWYLASYLIIKQLKYGRNRGDGDDDEHEDDEIDELQTAITRDSMHDQLHWMHPYSIQQQQLQQEQQQEDSIACPELVLRKIMPSESLRFHHVQEK